MDDLVLPTERRLAAMRTIVALIAARGIADHVTIYSKHRDDPSEIIVSAEDGNPDGEITQASDFARAAMDWLDPDGDGHLSFAVLTQNGDKGAIAELCAAFRATAPGTLVKEYDSLPVGLGHGDGCHFPDAHVPPRMYLAELLVASDEDICDFFSNRLFQPNSMALYADDGRCHEADKYMIHLHCLLASKEPNDLGLPVVSMMEGESLCVEIKGASSRSLRAFLDALESCEAKNRLDAFEFKRVWYFTLNYMTDQYVYYHIRFDEMIRETKEELARAANREAVKPPKPMADPAALACDIPTRLFLIWNCHWYQYYFDDILGAARTLAALKTDWPSLRAELVELGHVVVEPGGNWFDPNRMSPDQYSFYYSVLQNDAEPMNHESLSITNRVEVVSWLRDIKMDEIESKLEEMDRMENLMRAGEVGF